MTEYRELPKCWDDEDGDHLWIEGHVTDTVAKMVFDKWVKDNEIDSGYEIGGITRLWHKPTVPDDELLHEVTANVAGAEPYTRILLTW